MTTVPARYFDGRQAAWREVSVAIGGERVSVSGPGVEVDEPIGAVVVSGPLGRTGRRLGLSDGTYCELAATAEVDRALAAAGLDAGFVARWERSRAGVIGAVVLLIVLFVALYRFGIPALADEVAGRMPQAVADQLSREVMDLYEQHLLGQTALDAERQETLARATANLALPRDSGAPALAVLFRSSERLGANAFALPSGVVVVTDDLVSLAANDEEVLAIIAHEAGHVHRRHGLRKLLQSSAIGFLVGWYLGDLNLVVALAPTALLTAKYSRDLEREADDFAAEVLRASAIAPGRLADILERFDGTRAGLSAEDLGYISSHPTTTERIERLRQQR